MVRRAILIMALLAPVAAHSQDVYRWRDARGRVHYSNDQERIPDGAQAVTRRIGEIAGAPIGAPTEPSPPQGAVGQPPPTARWAAEPGCVDALGLFAFPQRSVDFDRWSWFDVDRSCGPQPDLEGWLRGATTTLERRKIGL